MNDISPGIIKRINDSNSIEILREKLKIENDQDIFKLLMEYLDVIVEKYGNQYREASYKIIRFLEVLATTEINNLISKCSMITEEKQKIIDILKDDSENLHDKEKVTLKELANKLENLEVSMSFNINSLSIIENYNVVKYILFKKKNKNLSTFIIDNNSYLIEAFNKNNENILIMLTESYLRAIEDFVKDKNPYDLSYFDEVLEKILTNDKIKIDKKIIETCINMVINYDKSQNKNNKEHNRAIPWYKHLEKKLDNPNYEEDKEELNYLYGVSPYFKRYITDEGYTLGREDSILQGYSRNSDYIITVDNNLGFDKDDAISVSKENGVYKLKIFVADPNTFCLEEGYLLEEARRRAETIYLEHESAGIFPREIIAYYMSLEQSCNRHARVYEFDISENGIIIDFKIKKEIINVSRNYSYDELDNALYKSNDPKEYMTIQNLLDLKELIDRKYIYGEGIITDIKAETLLESFMVFTNSKVAEFFSSYGIPFVYKHHSSTDSEAKELIDNLDNKSYRNMIKDAIKEGNESVYSTSKKSHEGLNLDYYCHCTSPLHNYADILVNECEDRFYFNNPRTNEEVLSFEEYLNDEVDYLNGKSSMLDRYRKKYKKAKVRSRK